VFNRAVEFEHESAVGAPMRIGLLVQVLLTHGAKVNGRFTELRTSALMTSSYHGHAEVVRELLSRGARVQAVDKQGSTALSYAFGGQRSVIAK